MSHPKLGSGGRSGIAEPATKDSLHINIGSRHRAGNGSLELVQWTHAPIRPSPRDQFVSHLNPYMSYRNISVTVSNSRAEDS